MSEETPKRRFRPIYLVLLAIAAYYQVRTGMEAEGTLSRPSDMSLIAQILRTGLGVAWMAIIMFTPTLETVFVGLFSGFALMFLAGLQEWVWWYYKPLEDAIWLYDAERTFGILFVSLGLIMWSKERRKDEQSLKTMSATDSLTGLYNTRFFHREMENEIGRIRRYKRDMSLVLLRVDGFRDYNETQGYTEGDKVLKGLGGTILGYLRRSDLGCRFGGDKFAVLLPETPLGGGALVAERLVQRLEAVEFSGGATARKFTMSAGVVHLLDEDTPQSLVRRCEALLDRVEKEGGGKILKA